MNALKPIFLLTLIGLLLQACYYDNAQDLYPTEGTNSCDTLNISYSGFILPLLETHCINCHSGATPQGNISLETYTQIKSLANNGRLLGVISHSAGFSPMPKGANKLPACEIEKLDAWIIQGTLEN